MRLGGWGVASSLSVAMSSVFTPEAQHQWAGGVRKTQPLLSSPWLSRSSSRSSSYSGSGSSRSRSRSSSYSSYSSRSSRHSSFSGSRSRYVPRVGGCSELGHLGVAQVMAGLCGRCSSRYCYQNSLTKFPVSW